MISDPIALLASLCAVCALAFWLEGRFAWARSVGASLLIIVFGFAPWMALLIVG